VPALVAPLRPPPASHVSIPTGACKEAVEHHPPIPMSSSATSAMKKVDATIRISPAATNAARIKQVQAVRIGKDQVIYSSRNALSQPHRVWWFPLTTAPLQEGVKNRISAVHPPMWPIVFPARVAFVTKEPFRRSVSGATSVQE